MNWIQHNWNMYAGVVEGVSELISSGCVETFKRLSKILLITLQSCSITCRDAIPQPNSGREMPFQRTLCWRNYLINSHPLDNAVLMDVRLHSQSHTKTATSSPFHTFSLRSNLGSIPSHSQTNCNWMRVYVRHSGLTPSPHPLQGCLQWTEKRGHSVQWSDDWAADTGKKEADRGRNKERERCRSLPNCHWVTTVEHARTDKRHIHTQSDKMHVYTHTHKHTGVASWMCVLSLYMTFNLWFIILVCVCVGWGVGGGIAALTARISERCELAVRQREIEMYSFH